jgi:hypothetical protein
MRYILIAAAACCFLAGNQATAQTATPLCKGAAEDKCKETSGCAWTKALVAGETITRKGEPSKVNRKAHCRKVPARQLQPVKRSEAA